MGCVVNGLGEGREADVGIAGGKDGGALFVKGQEPRKVKGDLAEILIEEVRKIINNEQLMVAPKKEHEALSSGKYLEWK